MKPFKLCMYVIFFFGMGCGVQKDIPMKVNYTDHNNNRYLITETTFNYIPITEKESSSGTYNGGKPISKKITEVDFNKLLQLAEEIIATATKDVKREMMTSVVSITRNGIIEQVTLRKSDKQKALEKLLIKLKTTSK